MKNLKYYFMSTENEIKIPFYAKLTIILVGFFVLVAILFIAKDIIIPLVFAIIIAVVLHPVVNLLVRFKINRVLAIIITLVLSILVFISISALIISQLSRLGETWPQLVDRFTEILNDTIIWASYYFDISTKKIIAWIAKNKVELIENNTEEIGHTLIAVLRKLVLVILTPVYVFMLLFYQPIIIEFFRRSFGSENREQVSKIISEIKTLIQRYLIGLSIEVVIIAILFSSGLLILGIDYAIILGIIGALLNLIPYIGAIIGAIFPMMIAVITKPSPWYALLVMALYIFVQFVDNNYIIPKVVASKVKINALVSIIAVIAFGTLWGIPGMFLAIPLTAIIKLIFDHFEPLEPWGFLLGDTMPQIKLFDLKLKMKNNNTSEEPKTVS